MLGKLHFFFRSGQFRIGTINNSLDTDKLKIKSQPFKLFWRSSVEVSADMSPRSIDVYVAPFDTASHHLMFTFFLEPDWLLFGVRCERHVWLPQPNHFNNLLIKNYYKVEETDTSFVICLFVRGWKDSVDWTKLTREKPTPIYSFSLFIQRLD